MIKKVITLEPDESNCIKRKNKNGITSIKLINPNTNGQIADYLTKLIIKNIPICK